tara:strand:- start:53 stop:499 length:447 start_codon:yes stop_codon:yes gene_type:complete
MNAKKIVIIFAVLLMLTGGIISVLKWLKIGPFSNTVEIEEVAPINPPLTIKMDKLSIPIFADDRIAATILIELKLEALGAENQVRITKQLPRLTDAFFKDLYVFVPQLIRRNTKLTTSILATRMQKIAKKVLGEGVLHKVIILKVSDS